MIGRESSELCKKKSRIRETSNLSTDADRRTDTILERLRDLSQKNSHKKNNNWGRGVGGKGVGGGGGLGLCV